MLKRKLNIAVSVITALILIVSAVLYFIVKQRTTSNSQELAVFPALGPTSFLTGEFQDKFEQALKDQFVLHDQAIAVTAAAKASLRCGVNTVQNVLSGKSSHEGLMPFGNVYRIYGTSWLTGMPYVYNAEDVKNYRKKADEINSLVKKYSSIHFYVYYCSRAEDLNWFDSAEGIKSCSYAQLLASYLDPSIGFDRMKFRDFDEYSQLMYKTDHHWNNLGASRGYSDILRLLSKDFPIGQARSVIYTEDFDNLLWQGSRARESAVSISPDGLDRFAVDVYQLDQHKTWFGDKEQVIGLSQAYAEGEINRELGFDQYLNYFGFESKPIRLEYENSPNNLLIIGDSFARALREPLASHFGTTVYVNFRILSEVNLDEIIKNYNINAVLFMGQQDAWSGYFLHGGETK